MVDPGLAQLEIRLGLDSAHADQIDSQIRQLSSELRDLGLATAYRTQEPPPGTKSGTGLVLGNLLVDVLPNTISSLLDFLQSWLKRRAGRTLKIVIKIGDRSVEIELDPQTTSLTQAKALMHSILRELNKI